MASTGTGHGPGAIAIAHGGIWVANRRSRTVARLEPRTLELSAIQRFRQAPVAIAACPEAVWALGWNGWLWRLWPDTQRAEGIARLGRKASAIAAAGDMIWALRRNGWLYGVEPASRQLVVERRVPRGASHLVAHDGALWASCGRDRRLVGLDARTGRPEAEIPLAQRARCLVAAENMLLAGCARTRSSRLGCLHTIDCQAQQIISTIELPSQPRAIAVDGETAWVACGRGLERGGTIERVDLAGGQVVEWRGTDWAVGDLALVEDTLLVSMSLEVTAPIAHPEFVGGGAGGGCGGEGGGGGGGHC